MHILSPVDFKAALVGLIGDPIFDPPAKHHLIATHIIVHAVFELRHKRISVHYVEVNQLVSCDLDSYVAFDKVNEASDSNFIILGPRCFSSNLISFLLEKQDSARTSHNQDLALEKNHLT